MPLLLSQEIRLLERISHDRNIVQFYGACLQTNPPMLVMEYMGVRATLAHLHLNVLTGCALMSPSLSVGQSHGGQRDSVPATECVLVPADVAVLAL